VESPFGGIRQSLEALLRRQSLVTILSAYLAVVPFWVANGTLFPQYVRKYFGWTLAQVGYLNRATCALSTLVLLILLPWLGKQLTTTTQLSSVGRPAPLKDLWPIKASLASVALAMFLLTSGNIALLFIGLIVQSLGAGLDALLRALATVFINKDETTKLKTLIVIFRTVAELYSGPVLAWLFTTGLKLGGGAAGLPFLSVATGQSGRL